MSQKSDGHRGEFLLEPKEVMDEKTLALADSFLGKEVTVRQFTPDIALEYRSLDTIITNDMEGGWSVNFKFGTGLSTE